MPDLQATAPVILGNPLVRAQAPHLEVYVTGTRGFAHLQGAVG